MEALTAKLQEWITLYGLRVLGALAILIVGRIVAGIVKRVIEQVLAKARTDATLVSFVGHLSYWAMLVFVILAALNQVGVQTTSFIAVIGAAGLAVGLALQGSLANFAAGVLLIIFRPFKVDDLIEGAGVLGVVQEIQIFTTLLRTPDNKAVIVPNAKLTGDNIINYSRNGTRRVDLVIGVSYQDDILKVKRITEEVLAADERVLKDPAPTVAVCELADSSVNFAVRPWCRIADYWDVYFGITEKLKLRYDAEGITIPFPQQDVHLFNKPSTPESQQ